MIFQRLMVGIFLLPPLLINAQTDPCDAALEIVTPIVAKFSRLPPENSLRTADSILMVVKDLDCPKVLLETSIIKGRYAKDIGKMDDALVHFNAALDYALETENDLRQKDIYVLIAVLTNESDSNQKAIEYLDLAFELPCNSDPEKCQKTNVKIIINKATFLKNKQSYSQAIDNFIQADSLIVAYNIPDSIYKVSVYNAIGNIYEEMQDLEQSAIWHKRALEYCPYQHPARFSLFNNIGHRYRKLNKTDSAVLYYNKTLDNTDLKRYRVTPYQGLGDIAYDKKDSKAAIIAYKKALENAEAANIVAYITISSGLLGKAYYLDGQYSQAKKFMTQFQTSMDPDNTLLEEKVELEKYMLLNELQNKDRSLHDQTKTLFSLRDSLFDLGRSDAIAEMTSRYENRILTDSLATLQIENQNKQLEAKVSKLFNVISLLVLAVLGFLGFSLFRKFKKQQAINETLVFEKSELVLINNKLKTQIAEKEEKERLSDEKVIPVVIGDLEKIEIKSTDKTHLVQIKNIVYLSAEDNGVRLYLLGNKSLWSDIRLKELEDKLQAANFLKIFRGTVVNFAHVDWVNHSSLMMNNGTELKIGRTYKKDILGILKKG